MIAHSLLPVYGRDGKIRLTTSGCELARLLPAIRTSWSLKFTPECQSFLAEEDHAKWLGEIADGDLKELLKSYPADEMKMWSISQRVNSPKNDDPSLVEPLHAQPSSYENR